MVRTHRLFEGQSWPIAFIQLPRGSRRSWPIRGHGQQPAVGNRHATQRVRDEFDAIDDPCAAQKEGKGIIKDSIS